MRHKKHRGGEIRGEGLQCPWSNCFPLLYENSRTPCALTAFADFREMIDHIWKYHSFRLSCGKCDYRFLNAKRGDAHRADLDALKKKHLENDCENVTTNPECRMSEERDEMLKSWKYDKDESSVKQNYYSLCRCLFGNGVGLPGDHKYHYLIPEHKINKDSFNLGTMNLEYIRQSQCTTELASTSGTHQQLSFTAYGSQHMQPTIDPLLLDEHSKPREWIVSQPGPDQDSAYESGGAGKPAPQQNTDSDVMGYIHELDWPQLPIDAFSQDTLHQRPASITECDWELENYDGPPE